jgi:hypothetical protein
MRKEAEGCRLKWKIKKKKARWIKDKGKMGKRRRRLKAEEGNER